MKFKEYEERTIAVASYKDKGNNLVYALLGLTGEAGEVADKLKKIIRVPEYVPGRALTEEERKALLSEVGDVLWYVASCAFELGSNLEEVAKMNIEKVNGRKERGTTHGSGDTR